MQMHILRILTCLGKMCKVIQPSKFGESETTPGDLEFMANEGGRIGQRCERSKLIENLLLMRSRVK